MHNIRVQNKNTCHFKGLLAALKHECLANFQADPEVGVREWKVFKVAFGNYLLQNPNLNSKIKILASDQQGKRSQKTELTNLFQDSISQGRFEESLKAYHAALHILGSILQNERPGLSPMKTLNDLDKAFKLKLSNNLIHIDAIESELKALDNPCINLSLEIFKNAIKAEQNRSEAAVDEELYKIRYDLNLIFDEIKQWEIFNIAEKTNQSRSDTVLDEKQIMPKNKLESDAISEKLKIWCLFTPVSKKKMLEWLETVSNEPKLLTHLDQRPLFVFLLVQGIYLGEMAKVFELYERLDSKDKEVLINSIEDFRLKSPYFGDFTTLRLADSLYDAYYASPDHPLMASLVSTLMFNAIRASSLKDIYLLEKVKQGEIYLDRETSEFIKPTREQIEAFFAEVNEEDFNKLPLYLVENILYALMKQVVRSGELDILGQIPEFIYNVCVELPQKNLPFDLPEEGILNKLVLFQQSHENESKSRPLVFNDTITLNQYRYRQFEKLLDPAKSIEIKGRIFPEFSIDMKPEDIIPLQNLLLKNKSDSLDDFIIYNFMKSVPAWKDKNLVNSFLQFCLAHKRESLHRWLNLDEYPGPLKIPKENRLFVLECVIGQPALFDEDLIERIIYMNVPTLDDEGLQKIENWLVAMNKKELLLESKFLRLMPYELIEKYPDSLLVKKRLTRLVEE